MKKEYLLFLILPISQVMMIAGDQMNMGFKSGFLYAGIVLGVIADIILFYVLLRGAKKEEMERELEEVRYLNEAESIRNDLLQEQQNRLYEMKKNLEEHM